MRESATVDTYDSTQCMVLLTATTTSSIILTNNDGIFHVFKLFFVAVFGNVVINDMTSGGQTLLSFMKHKEHESMADRRVVLIMDEMDGLGGSSDRGGVQALMKLMEKTKCPIICICNDRMNPKVRKRKR